MLSMMEVQHPVQVQVDPLQDLLTNATSNPHQATITDLNAHQGTMSQSSSSSTVVGSEASLSRVTDEELERLEDDRTGEETQPATKRAPPLPLEHIYVHDDANPLRLTDFEVLETLGESDSTAGDPRLARHQKCIRSQS